MYHETLLFPNIIAYCTKKMRSLCPFTFSTVCSSTTIHWIVNGEEGSVKPFIPPSFSIGSVWTQSQLRDLFAQWAPLKCLVGNQSQSSALVSTCQSLGQLCRPCDNTWPLALAETRGRGDGAEGGRGCVEVGVASVLMWFNARRHKQNTVSPSRFFYPMAQNQTHLLNETKLSWNHAVCAAGDELKSFATWVSWTVTPACDPFDLPTSQGWPRQTLAPLLERRRNTFGILSSSSRLA